MFRYPSTAQKAFGGSIVGSASINFNGVVPVYQVKQTMNNINVRTMLSQLIAENKLSGTGSLNFNIRTSGGSQQVLMRQLTGTAQLRVNKGAVQGVDLDYQLSRAGLSFMKISTTRVKDRGFTPFTSLRVNANFANGVMNNPLIELRSDVLQADAKGTMNLLNNKIKYKAGAKPLRKIPIKTGNFDFDLSDHTIPVVVTGTVTNPKISIDIKRVAQKTLQHTIQRVITSPITAPKTLKDTIEKLLPF